MSLDSEMKQHHVSAMCHIDKRVGLFDRAYLMAEKWGFLLHSSSLVVAYAHKDWWMSASA